MKKLFSTIIIIILLMASMTICVTANNNEISVYLDGEKIEFDVQPKVVNGRTLVPVRAIFEALGAEVEWDNETRSALGEKMGIVVTIFVDKNIMIKNCNEIALDVPAQIVDGRTLVPIRAISESFGVDVQWDNDTRTVILKDKNILQALETEGKEYYGEVKDGKPYGYGTMFTSNEQVEVKEVGLWDNSLLVSGFSGENYANGDSFFGYRTNNERNGYGEYYYASGAVYKGNYLDGKANGYGEHYYASGDSYKGNYLNGEIHGYGEYYWADGSYYKGEHSNGVRHGKGKLYDAITKKTYEGEFENGKFVSTETDYLQTIYAKKLTKADFSDKKFPLYLYSNDGKTFLGKLTSNKYDSESIFNEYSAYGSKYSAYSIFNEYGIYGSSYSSQSAFYSCATTPPIIMDSNYEFVGYLTTNKGLDKNITVSELLQILLQLYQ